MKKSIFILGLTAIMAGVILTSCESNAKKEESAENKVQEAKQDLKEVRQDANAEAQKTANAEEWKAFKIETEIRISKNEVHIAELKARMKKPGKVFDGLYEKKIDALEKRNRELRARLDAYEKSQSDWASFKNEFNHDMDELGNALKDLTVDNKK